MCNMRCDRGRGATGGRLLWLVITIQCCLEEMDSDACPDLRSTHNRYTGNYKLDFLWPSCILAVTSSSIRNAMPSARYTVAEEVLQQEWWQLHEDHEVA